MKQTVNLYTFRQAFADMGRKDQFSYEGLEILFNYLTDLEQVTGEEMELDVIAICCDYCEDTPQNIAYSYDIDLSECTTQEEIFNEVMEYLLCEGVLVDQGGSLSDGRKQIIYRNF